MYNIRIAELIISIDNKYDYVKERCRDYITNEANNTGIELSVTNERMQESIDYKLKFDGETIGFPEAEFDAIHYALYAMLHNFDALWLHSVFIDKGGDGFAFTGAPGTGKTTHGKLWLEVFDDATIVNGDNTIIRRDKESGIFYGYGTPFCGKEGFNKNCKIPIKAICFLERSETNFVEEIGPIDSILQMRKDNFTIDRSAIGDVMRLYLDMASQVKFYRIHCNMDIDAPRVAYEAIAALPTQNTP